VLPERTFAHGFSLNKRRHLRAFAAGSRVQELRHGQDVPRQATLFVWGSAPLPEGLQPDTEVIRVEDGFLRSVGLGAELVRPVSWVMDRTGLYYDSSRPSDLERLLQQGEFAPQVLARAAALRARLVASGITKYSVGQGAWKPPADGRVILAPGQVESDASLRMGAPALRTNVELVRAVRAANPRAYLVYKPHPDVTAGLRLPGSDEHRVAEWCDEVVRDVDMGVLLQHVHEVHVLTSLAGFEALLRDRAVVCYGQPFYAGWGLTTDVVPVARRTRRLSLDELVAGALILYPRYVSRMRGGSIDAEQALDELLQWRESGPPWGPWQYLRRAAVRLAVGRR
jgi:capsular polysaccharide export protein